MMMSLLDVVFEVGDRHVEAVVDQGGVLLLADELAVGEDDLRRWGRCAGT